MPSREENKHPSANCVLRGIAAIFSPRSGRNEIVSAFLFDWINSRLFIISDCPWFVSRQNSGS